MILKIKRMLNELVEKISHRKEREDLQWKVAYWRHQAQQKEEQVVYLTQVSEYYKSQWEEALKYLPKHVRDDMITPVEARH